MRLRRSQTVSVSSSAGLSTSTEDAELLALRTLLDDPIAGPDARALLSVGSRREARDRHAMSVLLASILSRRAHTVDVGAHSGAVLREILRVAPAGRHIAYEPIPELAQSLAEQFPAVTVRAAALSDKSGEASFVHVDSAPEYSGLREREYHGVTEVHKHEITVRTERLDDALPDGFRPDFIKIDVEGAEMLVLRGATQTLRKFRPAIVFEHGVGASERYGTKPEDVFDLLAGELAMRIFDLDGAGPYTREHFVAIFAEPLWNFLAVPD
jgi:FkbM family methyltransferase